MSTQEVLKYCVHHFDSIKMIEFCSLLSLVNKCTFFLYRPFSTAGTIIYHEKPWCIPKLSLKNGTTRPWLIGGHTCRLYFISTSFPLFVFWSFENGAKEETLLEVVRRQSPGFFLEIAVGKGACFSRRGVQQHVNLFNWFCAQWYNCAKCHL